MRRIGELRGLVLVLVIGLSAVALRAQEPATNASAGEELDRSAPLAEFDARSTYLRIYPLGRHKAVEKPAERRVRLDKKDGLTLTLVDVNGNGRFDDLGVDGWTRAHPDFPFLLPLEKEIAVGALRLRWRIEKDTFRFALSPYDGALGVPDAANGRASRTAAEDVAAGLAAWNDLRMRHGLVPVHLDAALSDGCRQHALYCAANGITHKQDPERSHASPAGAETARWCGIGQADPVAEIDLAFRSLYHRIQLIHPTTVEAGIGWARGITVLDGSRGRRMFGPLRRKRRAWDYPVLIPAPGSEGNPRTFSVEQPRPHPGHFPSAKALKSAGLPITMTFLHGKVGDVSAELRRKGPDGPPVEFLLSSPEKPANPEIADNYKTIALVPLAPLKSRATYWVKVVYTPTDADRARPVTRTWTFGTGR